jgi:glutathione S-transferase
MVICGETCPTEPRMSLILHYHPLSSCCQKVLVAIYETGAPVALRHLDLGDASERDAHRARWPLGKMPLLEDEASGLRLPETSIIIEHLAQRHPGPAPLLPADAEACLQVRLWDRLCDFYVMTPLQSAVAAVISGNAARAEEAAAVSRAQLETAYGVLDRRLAGRAWLGADAFSLADCAAMPALFYAAAVRPFAADFPALDAYFARLLQRPTVQRVLAEAAPWMPYFPLLERLPAAHREAVGV